MTEPKLKKDKLYVWSVILIITGYSVCLMPYWWIFGTPLILITGIVLIWLSKKTNTIKILFTIMPFILWLPGFWALLYFGSERMPPETFLIPKNFRGKITLYYGEPCGQTLIKENGRYIYHIPVDGIMVIKNPLETGIIDQNYFFVDSTGKKISKIDLLIRQDFNEDYTIQKNKHEPSRKKVGVFLGGTGSGGSDNGGKDYQFHEMYVDSWDSLRVYSDKKTDSIGMEILNNCRQGKNN